MQPYKNTNASGNKKNRTMLICILVSCLVFVVLYMSGKLPSSVNHWVLNVKNSVLNDNLTVNDAQNSSESSTIFVSKGKDGVPVFSNKKTDGATQHKPSGSLVIVSSDEFKQQAQTDTQKTGISVVLDPVQSIQSEAKKNVQKMQEAKNKQMEF